MRRVLALVFGALAGTTLLVGLKSQVVGAPPGVVADAPLDPAGVDAPTTEAEVAPSAAAPTAPGTQPKPGATRTTPPPSAPAVPPQTKSVTGTAVAVKTAQSPNAKSSSCRECHDYTTTVTITVSGGRITSAKVAYDPYPGRSLSYATRATNSLNQKVLTAQTWNLGRVSGATYSANAYELSLKDAMAKAGLPT